MAGGCGDGLVAVVASEEDERGDARRGADGVDGCGGDVGYGLLGQDTGAERGLYGAGKLYGDGERDGWVPEAFGDIYAGGDWEVDCVAKGLSHAAACRTRGLY